MKLLTLNAYSWVDTDDTSFYAPLISDILENGYEAIALQEVNQLSSAPVINEPEGYHATQQEIPIKENNFAYFLVQALAEKGLAYQWSWVPCHVGYDIYDEGVALLSKAPIQSVTQVQLSEVNDFESIHTRRALVVETEAAAFASVHLSWWKDEEENPFLREWASVETAVKKMRGSKPIYVMGDFNNPADARNEGYDLITHAGWQDAYTVAAVRIGSATVPPAIAGWEGNEVPLRIDYIFSDRPQAVETYEVKFDGNKLACVSDHYGVAVTYA
ncbi:maltose 6'-phosphate phosphatase [Trichococcus patagoniensis]|uniref:Maltose 6'-phosphate phosphatase n=1 Tax=Trichococcus patagoniensis TaxID=382641 RepID=A0A2T5INP8_9LACT|nr:endonuclease/exonuclease/phosphatase family protein [Trichococcus patagoniensis]PTQ85448.1 maltose 6'-phosphate phosphatase [Trichococcus patagoniensis]